MRATVPLRRQVVSERVVSDRMVVAIRDGEASRRPDAVAAEEPLEIRVNGEPVSVTMRTPGNDFELAVGFCFTEAIIDHPEQVATVRYCSGDGPDQFNVVDVRLRDPGPVAEAMRRNVYTTSSCGVCGTSSIEAVRKRVQPVHDDPTIMTTEWLSCLPGRLRTAQEVFDRTGGLHAAAVFEAGGELVCVREDVGRHNAVDKVIGWAATVDALPLTGKVLVVSGRVAFEIVQKALRAGIPALAAVSAPTSLAIALAEESGMTLVGFLRGRSMNVYTGADRVTMPG